MVEYNLARMGTRTEAEAEAEDNVAGAGTGNFMAPPEDSRKYGGIVSMPLLQASFGGREKKDSRHLPTWRYQRRPEQTYWASSIMKEGKR